MPYHFLLLHTDVPIYCDNVSLHICASYYEPVMIYERKLMSDSSFPNIIGVSLNLRFRDQAGIVKIVNRGDRSCLTVCDDVEYLHESKILKFNF